VQSLHVGKIPERSRQDAARALPFEITFGFAR
jgi:hypothetical protein